MKLKKKEKSEEEKLKRAKIELIIFLVFIIFAFLYSRILVAMNYHSNIDKEEYFNKVELSSLNRYDFEINLNVDNDTYNYQGNIDNGFGNINGYKIVNNDIYDDDLNKVDDVFYKLDNKYFSLNTLNNYIKEDNYKNNRYEVNINDIINNYMINTTVYLNIIYNKDNIIINIDYSNLLNDVNSYKVEYKITNYK